MKRRRRRQRQLEQRNREAALLKREAARRGGSTLMIVIALLAMLSLVGVVFYTFAAQERSNAEYFAYARKAEAVGDQPGDVFFDWALRQLIVGPEDYEQQSALWGRSHSMVPNMFGRDVHPYTGAGINLISDSQGRIFVDQNFNGVADDGGFTSGNSGPKEDDLRNLLEFNVSPAARNGATLDLSLRFPRDIDVDYTYPDINNLFVSYNGRGVDPGGSGATRMRRVIIPSFHRPQYLRNPNTGAVISDWYENTNTATRVLRPHPDHENVVDGSARYFGIDGIRDAADGSGVQDDFPFRPLGRVSRLPTDGRMGVWTDWGTSSLDEVYELDVDNDGDGSINEGVWLDLGYPVQTLADGTEYVPMMSYTVMDVDSKLNLNVHGNTRQIPNIDGNEFGGGQFISTSNQGISPGEVNLQYAFHANPAPNSFDYQGDAASLKANLEQYLRYFNRDPDTTPISRLEMMNMEYWFLTRGRPEFGSADATQADVTDLYPGRYGEHLTTMYNAIRQSVGGVMTVALFPQPGRSQVNDQGTADPNFDVPSFVHPLAYNGRGRYVDFANYKRPNLQQPLGGGNPSAWLRYENYQVRSNILPRWGDSTLSPGTSLVNNATGSAQIDDSDEIVVERDFKRATDEIFGADETAYAQLSTGDRDKISAISRLEELMVFGQSIAEKPSKRAASKRVTAQSFDRQHYGFPRNFVGKRGWEFNRDVNNDGITDAFPPTFKPDSWNDDLPTDGGNGAWNTVKNREPFRNALTLLMAIVNESTSRGRPQFKLNVNKLLYSPAPGRLAYRQLTNPASNWVQAARDRQTMCRDIYVLLYTLGGGVDGVNYAGTNDHSNTMTTTGAGAANDVVYTPAQLRQMAQFAVNLVDSMDRDDVITVFEYDKNLGATVDDSGNIENAGWNLDDNPLTDEAGEYPRLLKGETGYDADHPLDSIERGVVYGAEAQQLTFSEALWARVLKQGASQSNVMLYDESKETHEHLFIELRNASPFNVPLAHSTTSTTAARGQWQIRVEFDAIAGIAGPNRTLTFLTKAGTIGPGGQFTIGASNGKDTFPIDPMDPNPQIRYRPADIFVDYDLDGKFDQIAPWSIGDVQRDVNTTASAFGRASDLDLTFQADETLEFAINSDTTPAKGALLFNIDDLTTGCTMVLERRANLQRPDLDPNTQNPWVEVDRMKVPAKFLAINSAAMSGELKNINSSERVEPFSRGRGTSGGDSELEFSKLAVPPRFQYNTVGKNRNSRSPAKFTLWQQHFDRDFASVGELLGIPLYGPKDVTRFAGGSGASASSVPKHRPPLQEFGATNRYPLTAASLMLQPQHPSNVGLQIYTGGPGNGPDGNGPPGPDGDGPPGRGNRPPTGGGVTYADPLNDNRWYRLLEFVEVPTRTHLSLGDPLNISRVPGRMALNMMRDPESLAGLLDDQNVIQLGGSYLNDPTNGYSPMPGKQTEADGSTRYWWEQLIAARDREDPVTGLYLPGTASSRPFRSLSFVADGNRSIEHTLLRQLPLDENDDTSLTQATRNIQRSRRLLEIGNADEHRNGNVDPFIRHKLLSKVWGNTTNRSHVFVVFISVGYFEARDMGNGAVRIGKRLNATPEPEHRGVFVVNRSRIEEAIKPGTNKVNWRKLVDFRQTID
ncbi:MAG: hypothetical protein HOL01_01300 [Planctomycetaceae bacterium]|jgi:hypothetical protein|nr:hypothetical protein [Planctomycetaceae bacterium]